MNANAASSAPPKTEDEPDAKREDAVDERSGGDAEPARAESGAEPTAGEDAASAGLAASDSGACVPAVSDPAAAAASSEGAESVSSAAAEAEPPASSATTTTPPTATAPPVPEPRATADPDGEADRGKSRKKPKAVRGRSNSSTGGTKSLVVWHQGKVHYADDSVLVLDLDEAASPELDVHDLVDRLTELREALDSPGRSEAVAALVEIIQEKALA